MSAHALGIDFLLIVQESFAIKHLRLMLSQDSLLPSGKLSALEPTGSEHMPCLCCVHQVTNRHDAYINTCSVRVLS